MVIYPDPFSFFFSLLLRWACLLQLKYSARLYHISSLCQLPLYRPAQSKPHTALN